MRCTPPHPQLLDQRRLGRHQHLGPQHVPHGRHRTQQLRQRQRHLAWVALRQRTVSARGAATMWLCTAPHPRLITALNYVELMLIVLLNRGDPI